MSHNSTRQIGMNILAIFMLLVFLVPDGWSQTETGPVKGIRENTPTVHALVNARIVQKPGAVIEKGTIVVRDGVIEAVGADINIPSDARIWDYTGLTVYAGFIEMNSQAGLPKPKTQRTTGFNPATPQQPQPDTRRGPQSWNPNVKSHLKAIDLYKPDSKECEIMGIEENKAPEIYRVRQGGCGSCKGQGYKGRVATAEILLFDEELDEMVARNATKAELKAAAIEKGFKNMKDDGILKVLEGLTTLEALSKVIDVNK